VPRAFGRPRFRRSLAAFAAVALLTWAAADQLGATEHSPILPLRALPLEARDPVAAAAEVAPGAFMTSAGARLRGGLATNVATLVDGYRVFFLSPPLAFLERTEVLDARYGAVLGDVPEGAIVMRSVAPGQPIVASAERYRETNTRQAPAAENASSFAAPVPVGRRSDVLSASLGGEPLRDRLLLNALVSSEFVRFDDVQDPNGILPTSPGRKVGKFGGALRALYRPTPDHDGDALVLVSHREIEDGAPLGVERQGHPVGRGDAAMLGLGWTWRFTEGVSARLQASWERAAHKERSALCRGQSVACEAIPAKINTSPRPVQTGNGTRFADEIVTRKQLEARLGFAFGNRRSLAHDFFAWSRVDRGDFENRLRMPGNYVDQYNGLDNPEYRTEAYANDPRLEPARFGWSVATARSLRLHHGIEDEVRLARKIVLRPGVGLLTSRVHAIDGTTILHDRRFTLNLLVTFDPVGDGNTSISASTARRFDPLADGTLPRLTDAQVSQRCRWDPVTQAFSKDCVLSGGALGMTVGRPCGPSGVGDDGRRCEAALRMPETWEHTVATRQALGDFATLELALVYRRTTALPHISETNRIWNPSASVLLGYRNGRSETVLDHSTAETASRRYYGGTVSLRTQTAKLKGSLAYTYGRQQDQLPLGATGPGGVPRDLGPAATWSTGEHRPHSVRAFVLYTFFDYASASLTYAFDSGRLVDAPAAGYDNVRARRGLDPNTEPNDLANGRAYRLAAISRLNMQLRLRLGHWLPFELDGYLDLLNIFDDPYASASHSAGRWTRFGFEGRF
jgi:hypothetical protein